MTENSAVNTCFVISPIGEPGSPERMAADTVLRHLVKKALEPRFTVHRGDEDSNPGAISPQILNSIRQADLVVADLTGHNPNVFYELAMAHGFRKPTVHIQRDGERLAFDVKDMRIIRYDTTSPDKLEQAQDQLRSYAMHAVEKPDTIVTPLSSAERFAEVRGSTDPVALSNVQVLEALGKLSADVHKALRSKSGSVAGAPATDDARRDHMRGLRDIVSRVVDAGRADIADFTGVITEHTSRNYDTWMRRQLGKVTGEANAEILNQTLFATELSERLATGEDIGYSEDYDVDDDGPTK